MGDRDILAMGRTCGVICCGKVQVREIVKYHPSEHVHLHVHVHVHMYVHVHCSLVSPIYTFAGLN